MTAAARVLLIDDESSVLLALKLLLEAFGYQVQDFSDPTLAIEALKASAEPLDICLCDLRMPKLTGLQVLEQAKRLAPGIKFALMSAHASDLELKRARELGVDDTLSKPFTPDDLS